MQSEGFVKQIHLNAMVKRTVLQQLNAHDVSATCPLLEWIGDVPIPVPLKNVEDLLTHIIVVELVLLC